MHLDLSGRRALVTGGSGAIGRAACLSLARSGVEAVAFTFFSNHDAADETARLLRALGVEAHILRANLAHEEAAGEVVEGVRQALGKVDFFISNAASGVIKPALELRGACHPMPRDHYGTDHRCCGQSKSGDGEAGSGP